MDTECRIIIDPSIPEFKDCFYFEDKAKDYALLCYNLIKEVNKKNDKTAKIGLYETRHHAGAKPYGDYDCCWYLGFVNHEEEIYMILRFEIKESSAMILFQSEECVPKQRLKHEEKSIKAYGRWLPVRYSKSEDTYEDNELIEMINEYLENLQKNWDYVMKHCRKRQPCEISDDKVKVTHC